MKLLLCLFGCIATHVVVAQAPLQPTNNVAAYDAGQINDFLSRYAKRVKEFQEFFGPESTGLRKQVIAYFQSTTNAIPLDQKILIGACFSIEEDYRVAAKLLEEYLAVFTNSVHGWNMLGASYAALDEDEKAISSFEKAIALGDPRNISACCAAALGLGRLDVVKKHLPELLRLKQEPKETEGIRQQAVAILAVYAERTDDRALFSKALDGVKIESLASRDDILTVLKRVCEKFNSPEIAAQCEEISKTLQWNNHQPKSQLPGQTTEADREIFGETKAKSEKGDAEAQYNLGACYTYGKGVAKDEVEAVKWWRKAAEQNQPRAQLSLGLCYAEGQGVMRDEVEAVKWFQKAAEQNYAAAQNHLGVCYEKGQGVAKDEVEAVKWYRKAAEQNDVKAQINLGYCYNTGSGVRKDHAEAVKWYRRAAEQNRAEAQYYLGFSYAHGLGLAKDEVTAVKWYRRAAEQNYAEAQYRLGICYAYGKGVAKDEVEAVKWWRKAAEQNNAMAQNNLGICYRKGIGVAKDEAEALKWYRKAGEAGEPRGFNGLAWVLATSANPAIRDGANAVVFAEKAVAAADRKTPEYLDTLAAAYAEVGQFEKAVRTQQEAIALFQSEAEKNDCRSRLRLYEAKTPFREKD